MVVNFAPLVVERKIAAQRRKIIGQLTLGLIYVIAITILYLLKWLELAESLKWLLIFSVAITVVMTLAQVLWLIQLKRERIGLDHGLAMVLSPWGIETKQDRIPWSEVGSLVAVRGRAGHGYRLQVRPAVGGVASMTFPLDALDVLPGTLDSATRAFSGGRHGIDLSAVED